MMNQSNELSVSVKPGHKKTTTLEQLYLTTRPRGYETFFMLNSAEHEIFSANKYENAINSWHFHIYQQINFRAQLCLAI